MPDIRVDTTVVDDFDRPDEDPVLPPWQTDVGAGMKVEGNQFWGRGIPPAGNYAYYTPIEFDDEPMQMWARVGFAAPPTASGWRFGFCLAGASFTGYECLPHNNVGADDWKIRRYDGAGFTNLTSALVSLPTVNDLVLMQLDSSGVHVYHSNDDGVNWTLVTSAGDTTYRTNLYAFLGTTGTEVSWNGFGLGAEIPWLPSFLRRQSG